jgi:hypothetical protein
VMFDIVMPACQGYIASGTSHVDSTTWIKASLEIMDLGVTMPLAYYLQCV